MNIRNHQLPWQLLVLLLPFSAFAQTPVHEYIRLGARVVAIENSACYSLSSTSVTYPSGSATGSVSVTAASGMRHLDAIQQQPSFLTITGGSPGNGSGTVTFSVAANTGGTLRSGTLTIAGITFTVTQAGTSATGGLGFHPVTPCRVANTAGNRMQAGETRDFPISPSCGIPSTAQAYSLNVTVMPPGPLIYLSIWPTGQPQPVVSTLNSLDGYVVANAAIVPAGAGGMVRVYVSDATDVILDINGYFAPPDAGTLTFYPVTPCRVADTRAGSGFTGQFGPPSMGAGQTRAFPIPASSCSIPSAAQAYSLNLTVVPPGPLTYLNTWAAGQSQPGTSVLNAQQGQVVAGAAIVQAGTGGGINVFTSNATDVIIDINGYFAPPPGALYFYSSTPCRVADTRTGFGKTGAFGPPSLGAQSSRSFPLPTGGCGLPSSAQAYSLNLTVVPPAPLIYLTAWPTGQAQPFVSTLNSLLGKVVANAAIVPAGTGSAVSVFVSDATDVIIDVNGYFAQ